MVNNSLVDINSNLETLDNRFISELGNFKIVTIEDTMPTEIAEKRISFSHISGKAFLLSSIVMHYNGTWYGIPNIGSSANYLCFLGSNQIRLKISNTTELASYGGQKVRILIAIFE